MSVRGNNYRKTGTVELKRSSTVHVTQYKTRDIVVHPTLLSYFRRKKDSADQVQSIIGRPIEHKRDFLLAPLGFTEILQVKEDLLVLVSKRKKVVNERTGEVVAMKEPVAFQQLTLKFSSRDERDDWMRVIIAECDKVYLEGLIDPLLFFAGNFVEAANVEIWSSILLGDESLRRAYIAPAGSDQIEYVRLVLDNVIIWLQELLGIGKLVPVHKKVFVALLSLMLQDAAARALLMLVRPNPGFLLKFKSDTASGAYALDGVNDPRQIAVLEKCAAALSFVLYVKERVQSVGWKQYRTFLAIVDHPAMPPRADPTAAYVEVESAPGDELAWLSRCGSLASEFTWEMMKNAVSDTPYLAYYFTMKEILHVIDDERVRKVLMLVDRVPQEQRDRVFAADGVAKPVRQHFRALVEYCKFREVWKFFYVGHARSSPFFEELHMHLWSRITMTENPLLRGIFLPTSVFTTAAALQYADVLSIEMVSNGDVEFLRSLDINVSHETVSEDALSARVSHSHHKSTVYFRKLALHRLLQWAKAIAGVPELTTAEAPIFVNLFIAAAKSAVVRAVLWLVLPAPGAFQEGTSVTAGNPGSLALCDQFISSLLNLAKPSSRLERFLSFLVVAEHPLAGAVYTPPTQRNTSPLHIVKGPVAASTDAYAKEMTWPEEMVWMDKYPQQNWLLSWGELLLLLNDTPYFSLQVLMRRLHQETKKSLRWLTLLQSSNGGMPFDIVVTRFLADVNMCAVNGTHQFGSCAARMGAHFLTFIDSRRVTELWKLFQTNYLNSSTEFVEQAQNRLLLVLENHRESPTGNASNRSGFCQMMVLLDSATTADVATMSVTFSTLLPMAVWSNAALGDPMWRLLLSLFRSTGESASNGAPVAAVSALRSEHLTTFKKFLDHLAQWSAAFCNSDSTAGPAGGVFAELLSSCLDNAVLRAVLVIVEARRNPETAGGDQFSFEAVEFRLAHLLIALNQQKDDRYLLYLLRELEHPGTKQEEDGTVTFQECTWAVESNWLWATQRSLTIMFDTEDFALLADPAYLLFRYVSRNFRDIGEGNVHGLVNKVQKSLPDIVDKAFYAHDNYLPCREHQHIHFEVPVEGAHFKHLLTYTLFHEMWKIIMPRLTNPSLDLGFAQTVMYSSWLLVNSNANPDLSRLLLPLESDLHWQKLTYLVAVQRHAIIGIAQGGQFQLSRLYRSIVIPEEATISPDDISAHNLLIDRIIKWVHCLLGGKKHHLDEADAALFMEIFTAAAADGAMRAFLLTFLPAPSTVAEFMSCPRHAPEGPLSFEEEAPAGAEVHAAAIRLVKLLAQTFRSDKWRQFRSFLSVLHYKMRDAGKNSETEPVWTDESEWIRERLTIKSAMVNWQDLEYAMTDTPYIFLLLVSKALPTMEQQKAAMLNIPAKYLVEKFAADSAIDDTLDIICAPHFIAMCLHEATSEVALEVFQERGMISDAFFEALLSEAVLDSTCPRLLQAFRLLQRFLYADKNSKYYKGGSVFDVEMLRHIPNISSVLITFLSDISKREHFRRDEKIIGNLILLVFQLESCSGDGAVANVTSLASEWMRRDSQFATLLFQMIEALNFPKWFSRLCWNFNVHFGKNASPPSAEPVLAMDTLYEGPAAQEAAAGGDAAAVEQENTGGDVMLDPTIPLTKHKLTMGIVGFFNLCLEFKPEALCEFVAGLGTGRPFFSFFLHRYESLTEQVLLSMTSILSIKHGTILYGRVQERFLFYDNDHLTPAAVRTLGLRTSKIASPCLNLTDSEFTDLLTVAMYMHDLHNLQVRFENAVISMIADQERREMVVKFMKWMLEFFVSPDIKRECSPLNTKANERIKWKNCEKFKKVLFEDIVECANEATVAAHLLRGAARSNSYVTLERLFEHYIRNSSPVAWKNLFHGSKTIAYFIKYVDVEDLNLAFTKFFEMNEENNCFKHHLLKVRKLLTEPIVSSQDLMQLTASSSSFDENNAERFFEQLRLKASNLPAHQVDLKMVYYLTASWMKISKKKVLFPLPPRNAQIITLLTVASWAKSLLVKKDKSMGKALIAQVGTGEGKSLIIAMMAIYFVKVLNKRVHILENNPGLLEKDVETMTPLFAEFGIRTQHEGPGADSKPKLTWTSSEKQDQRDVRSDFCKFGVTYCLRRNLERYYQDSIMAEDFSPLANTVLIVDEVDDLIVDENPNQPYAAKDCEQANFQAACREAQIESDRADLEGGYFDVGEFGNGDFVRETAAYAYLRAKDMVLDRDYSIVGGKYVILQDGKPVELYDYSLECLKFIRNGIQPNFSSTYYHQSIPYMLSQYDCITGFSGSLGSPSERAFLAQEYKAWSFDTPSFLNTCTNVYKVPPALMVDAQHPDAPCVHVYDTVDEQVDKIVEMCLRLHLKVPVLVIAKSAEEAIAIEVKLKAAMAAQPNGPPVVEGTKHKYVQLFRQYKLESMTLDKENWGHMVRRATSRGPEEDRYCITVTDPFGGRGHDFDVHDDEVNRLGGLAVIMTSIPASEREWRQWKGRTARKDNRGQYAVVLNNTTSPVLNAKDILVDYALRRANQDAIPNLYKEELIDKLLSLQDENQLAKLRKLESAILTGRRLNRLCDEFYKIFGPMKESTWPESDEEVQLRKLLTDDCIVHGAITKAFADFQLDEFDSQETTFNPPDMKSSVFWSDRDKAAWDKRIPKPKGEEEEEEIPEPSNANASATAEAAQAAPVRSWASNPLISFITGGAQPTASSAATGPQPAAAVLVQEEAPRQPSAVKAAITKFESSSVLSVENARAQRRSSHNLTAGLKGVNSTPKPTKATSHAQAAVNARQTQPKPPAAEESSKKGIMGWFDMAYHSADEDEADESDDSEHETTGRLQNLTTPKRSANEESVHDIDLAIDLNAEEPEEEYEEPPIASVNPQRSPMVTPPPPPGVFHEMTGDNGGLSIMGTDAFLPAPAPAPITERRQKNAKQQAQPRAARPTPAAAVPAVEEPAGPTGKQAALVGAQQNAGTGKIAANMSGLADQSTGKVAANNTGHTETSGIKAMNMVRGAAHAREVRVLDLLCVGDTKRLTNQLGDLKEQLFAVPRGGDALTVSVTDITGPNAGNGVAGLEVSGAITTTNYAYTMVFEVKVTPEEYQFNMLLYGKKKLEAKWKGVALISAPVLFKPAPKVRPRGAYAFHNAANDKKIPAGGFVTFSSVDDPRSTPESPIFRPVKVSYTGGNVALPPSLPADCVVTVSPEIPGYSTEYSEKFVLFGGEKIADETMTMMLSETNLVDGEWRAVLSWNKHPEDLDLYCITNFNPRRVYFGAKNEGGKDNAGKGNIELDIDVRHGFGPETITFTPNPAKKYRFLVHNFTGNKHSSMANSGAKMVVNKGSGRPVQFEVPTDIVVDDSGAFALFWHVFDLFDGVLTPVNEVITKDLRDVPL